MASSARFEMKEGDEQGRKKIKICKITSQKSRQVTFNKRKVGLMKKAMELSILCECEIAVILFDSQKQLYQYSTRNNPNGMEQLVQRWKEYDGSYEALTNSDLQTLKPGRAASFRVGKKRKKAIKEANGGNSKKNKSSNGTANGNHDDDDDDDDDEDDDDDDEDDDEMNGNDHDSETPRSTPAATTSTIKHTKSHPLHSPSAMVNMQSAHQNISNIANSIAQPIAPIPTMQNPSLASTVHPLLTPLGTPHSFAAMLSPTSLPSANSLAAPGAFGSSFPFSTNQPIQPTNTLQQVLHSQASLLSPTAASPTASSLFAANSQSIAQMSPRKLQQLSQQLQQQQHMQQIQQQQVAVASRIVEQQQVQQQQQQLVAALQQQQQQQQIEANFMRAIQQQQVPSYNALGRSNNSPTVASSLSAALLAQPNTSSSLSALLSPGIPPSPSAMFNAPMASPSVYSNNPYNNYLSAQAQAQVQVNQQTALNNAVISANATLYQQQQQQQQQLQQMQNQQQLNVAAAAAAMKQPLPPLTPSSVTMLNPSIVQLNSSGAALTSGLNGHTPIVNSASPPTPTTTLSAPAAHSSSVSVSAPVIGSASASSLLSKRAPFKMPLVLEIPTKPNVANGDITNASLVSEQPATIVQASAPPITVIQPIPIVDASSSSLISSVSNNVTKTEDNLDKNRLLSLPTNPHIPSSHQSTSHLNHTTTPSMSTSNNGVIPVSAPANQSVDASNSLSMAAAAAQSQHPQSAYTSSLLSMSSANYSPLTSPSAFMSSDQHQQASMLFSINGSMSGMNVSNGNALNGSSQTVGVPSSSSSAASQSHSSLTHSHNGASASSMNASLYLQPPIPLSPYGQWGSSFSQQLDSTKIYSPTALRSPAAAAALFSRTFQ